MADEEGKTATESILLKKNPSLSPEEAVLKVDRLKERLRSFSASSSFSTEGSDDGKSDGSRSRLARKQDDLFSCLSVMRRLMEQSEAESKRLKEDKFVVAAKINNSLNSVNREVEHLKAELREQDRKLCELSRLHESSVTRICDQKVIEITEESKKDIGLLKDENERLRQENSFLFKELDDFKRGNSNLDLLKERLHCCEHEISRAKETITYMKSERKRLKSEKAELLGQMKQVYNMLEDKESELREFIKNYEQKMRESDVQVSELKEDQKNWAGERENLKKESGRLKSLVEEKDIKLVALESELKVVKERLTFLQSTVKDNRLSPFLGASAATSAENNLNLCSASSSRFFAARPIDDEKLALANVKRQFPEDGSGAAPEFSAFLSVPAASVVPVGSPFSPESQSSSSHHDNDVVNTPAELDVFELIQQDDLSSSDGSKKRRRRGTFGSLSRYLFPKTRSRRSLNSSPYEGEIQHTGNSPVGTLIEKKQLWNTHKDIPVVCWKANMVLAWLEVECEMPMYSQMCFENVKSGKVLLELSDSDLEAGLGITNIMHKRKLRLAIEEYRSPANVKYPSISQISHFWVARCWIRDIGLSQYGPAFEAQMVDGRMLNVLTKKDMEKYLNISKKFHQISILHGIQLLRMMGFDKTVLAGRVVTAKENDTDPVVWSNERVIKWCRSIDLGEYAENLRDSGVHGALMVLEPTFGPDELAHSLNIPSSKNIIRRHLRTEATALLIPARSALCCGPDADFSKKEHKRKGIKKSLSFSQRSSLPSDLSKRQSLRTSHFRFSLKDRESNVDCSVNRMPSPPILHSVTKYEVNSRQRRPKSSIQ